MARLVLVPHEPTDSHLSEVESLLRQSGLSFSRYSQAREFTENVLLVDQVGLLAELYAKAQFAFVGGSFKKTVHSVMEPLAAGCLTIVGPKHSNNREAIEFQTVRVAPQLTAVQSIDSSTKLAEYLQTALNSVFEEKQSEELNRKIKSEIEQRSGASARVIDWISNHL